MHHLSLSENEVNRFEFSSQSSESIRCVRVTAVETSVCLQLHRCCGVARASLPGERGARKMNTEENWLHFLFERHLLWLVV